MIEFFISCVVIIIFLLFAGVSPKWILIGGLWLMAGFFALMTIYIFVNLLLWLFTRKTKGEFLRIEKKAFSGSHAIYLIDGEEYPNTFIAETLFVRLYKKEKSVRLWQKKGKRFSLVFDVFSVVLMLTNLPIYIGATYAMIVSNTIIMANLLEN